MRPARPFFPLGCGSRLSFRFCPSSVGAGGWGAASGLSSFPSASATFAVLPPLGLPFVLLLLALLCAEGAVSGTVGTVFRLGFAFMRGFLALAYLLWCQFRRKDRFESVADKVERLAHGAKRRFCDDRRDPDCFPGPLRHGAFGLANMFSCRWRSPRRCGAGRFLKTCAAFPLPTARPCVRLAVLRRYEPALDLLFFDCGLDNRVLPCSVVTVAVPWRCGFLRLPIARNIPEKIAGVFDGRQLFPV